MLVPVARTGDPQRPDDALRFGERVAPRLLDRNPDVVLHHMRAGTAPPPACSPSTPAASSTTWRPSAATAGRSAALPRADRPWSLLSVDDALDGLTRAGLTVLR